MDIGKFKHILFQVLLLPVFALLLMALALYVEMNNGANTVTQIVQYDARIAQATLVYKLIVDEESGLRGYQTTGDPSFLDPYNKTEPLLEKQLSALESVASASQSEIDHIHHLREVHQTWRDGFALPVIATSAAGETPTTSTSTCKAKSSWTPSGPIWTPSSPTPRTTGPNSSSSATKTATTSSPECSYWPSS